MGVLTRLVLLSWALGTYELSQLCPQSAGALHQSMSVPFYVFPIACQPEAVLSIPSKNASN